MSYQDNYLEEYSLTLPLSISNNNEIILPHFQSYTQKVIKSWQIYNSLLLATKLVTNHPQFLPGSTGTDEILFNENFIPLAIDTFGAIYKSKLLRFIYDNVALNNLKKVIETTSTSNQTLISNLTSIEGQFNTIANFLISSDDSTDFFTFDNLDRILIFTRTQEDILYRVTDQEKIFIIFIIKILNYFLNFISTQTDFTVSLNHTTGIESSVVITILTEIYKLPENINVPNIFIDNLTEIAYFIIPYIKQINDTFNNIGIPNYFMGISIMELLFEEKKNNLIIIANTPLINNMPLCNINSPLFTSYYLQSS
jgi:hypothetical protein